jgi:hypothetical protein
MKKKAKQKPTQKKKKGAQRKLAPKKIAKKKKTQKKGDALDKKKAKPRAIKPVGKVTHFYTAIGVAIVRFKENVPAGTELHFQGATTDFKQTAKSMQYNHAPVTIAKKGKQIGIKVKKRVRQGDVVHRVNTAKN